MRRREVSDLDVDTAVQEAALARRVGAAVLEEAHERTLNPVMRALEPLMIDPLRIERRIGGMLAAAICGACSWAGPFDAYVELTEGYQRPVTKKMRAGKLFECGIYQWACEDFGWSAEWIGDRPITHPRRSWQRVSPDFVMLSLSDMGDAKRYSYASGHYGKPGTDEVPDYEMIQQTTYMEALRSIGLPIERSNIAVHDLHRDELLHYVIPYDETLGGVIVEACERFLRDHVEPRRPPDITGAESVRRYFERRHPRPKLDFRPATSEESAIVESIEALEDVEEEAKGEIERLRNELRQAIGDGIGLGGPGWQVTWKTVDVKAHQPKPRAATSYRQLKINRKGRAK